MCPEYTSHSSAVRRLVSVLSVMAVNALLQGLCPALVRREAHNTRTRERRAVALKLAIAIFASTALVPALANMAPTRPWAAASRYPDMTASWFRDVGLDLFIVVCCTFACDAFRPLGLWLGLQWRKRQITHALTQAQLTEAVSRAPSTPEFLPCKDSMTEHTAGPGSSRGVVY